MLQLHAITISQKQKKNHNKFGWRKGNNNSNGSNNNNKCKGNKKAEEHFSAECFDIFSIFHILPQ